eukprot:TRINITY_DN10744_c0_g1_i2.p1 TRINITY_DN10744_c0_g1~~TRINITY_DN10744_c0_g1_i2.p1  ORF type:complete len:422 (+),score=109.84 TRINITY_DN10744_c0_g1_i2:1278-2543(+)
MAEIAPINKFTLALRGGDIDGFYSLGEKLRNKLQDNGLIKDRTYRLKKYTCCFKGDELVDYLVFSDTCSSRAEALLLGCSLIMYGVIHHVVDDHLFKDEGLFYRFREDDGTYKANKRAYRLLARRALHIHAALHASGTMILDRDYGVRTFRKCFIGQELAPWLMMQELAKSKQDAITLANDLLEEGFMHHVTHDHSFKDEYLFYRWSVDELQASPEFESFIRSPKGGMYMGHIDNGLRLVLPAVASAFRRMSLAQGTKGFVFMDDEDGYDPNTTREAQKFNVGTMRLKSAFVLEENEEPPVPPPRKVDMEKKLKQMYKESMAALASAPWFHGSITREEAEDRLKAAGMENDGVYMVRLSKSSVRSTAAHIDLASFHHRVLSYVPLIHIGLLQALMPMPDKHVSLRARAPMRVSCRSDRSSA